MKSGQDLWRLLTRWRRLVMLCMVLGVVGGVFISSSEDNTFESETVLFISVKVEPSGSGLLQGTQFVQQRVKSYVELATSPIVLDTVARQIGMPVPNNLAQDITASAPLDSVLLTITARASSSSTAQRIAAAVADRMKVVVPQLDGMSGTGTPTVITTITPANASDHTIKTGPLQQGFLGGLLAGVVGLLLVVGLDAANAQIRDSREASSVLGLPVLAELSDLRLPRRRLTLAVADPKPLSQADSLRELRTALQFSAGGFPGCLAVLSPGRGDGRSWLVQQLGRVLAASGLNVVLLDGDLRTGGLSKALGYGDEPGLVNLLDGGEGSHHLLHAWQPRISVLPTGALPPNPSELLASQRMSAVVSDLGKAADIVLIDSPALDQGTDGVLVAAQADHCLLLVRSGASPADRTRRLVEKLRSIEPNVIGLCVSVRVGR